jgi:hypothetical protein
VAWHLPSTNVENELLRKRIKVYIFFERNSFEPQAPEGAAKKQVLKVTFVCIINNNVLKGSCRKFI